MTEPNPYLSTNTGLSVEPPNKDTRKGQDEMNIMKPLLYTIRQNF